MRTGRLVIVGAVLPLVLGASLGSLTTSDGRGTWAYPMPATAFLLLSLGLAVSHLLVVPAYTGIARERTGPAAPAALVGAAGTAALAACEVWSGLSARTALDAGVLDVLDAGYAVSAVAVLAGTLVAGWALRASSSPLAAPLLVNGLVLLVAVPVRFLGSDGLGIAGLTLWSLTYVWVGLRLRPRPAADLPRRSATTRR